MQYRKKPGVIEAWHFADMQAPDDLPEWLRCAVEDCLVTYWNITTPYILIKTPEGEMRADFGDWIIRGVKGELYPCKPDIFAATYEPVKADASARSAAESPVG